MAWTAPRTWVTLEVVSASIMNTHVRDNLLETAPAKATSSGQLFVATGSNAIAARAPSRAIVAASESTTSGSYVNLTTTGPAVTVTTGNDAMVFIYARLRSNSTSGSAYMSYEVSGATSDSANDNRALIQVAESAGNAPIAATAFGFHTSLTAGSNTFTAKYRSNGSATATFQDRRIAVIPL